MVPYYFINNYLPKSVYKKFWIQQIQKNIPQFSTQLYQVDNINDATIILCAMQDFEKNIHNDKKYIILMLSDEMNVNISHPNIICRLSAFKYDNDSNVSNLCILNTSVIYQPLCLKDKLPLNQRKFDVSFMGTVKYDVESITQHRMQIKNNIRDIITKNNLTGCVPDTSLPKKSYYKSLLNTKIFVSPHGYGQWSLKDFECVALGCIVIKPYINYHTHPNFYENFISFNNIEELEKTILYCLNNLDEMQLCVQKGLNMMNSYLPKCSVKILDKYLENNHK